MLVQNRKIFDSNQRLEARRVLPRVAPFFHHEHVDRQIRERYQKMGTSNFKIKVGKIDSANFICSRTDSGISLGSIRVKSKAGTEIYPMIFAADGKTLIPNPAFWQGTDVNMAWDEVKFDSFKTVNADPILPLVVRSIGNGKIPVKYDDIASMRDEVLKILFPGSEIKGRLGQLFNTLATKMKAKWLYALKEGGQILEPFKQLMRKKQPAPLARDETGARTIPAEFTKNYDRAVEHDLRLGR